MYASVGHYVPKLCARVKIIKQHKSVESSE